MEARNDLVVDVGAIDEVGIRSIAGTCINRIFSWKRNQLFISDLENHDNNMDEDLFVLSPGSALTPTMLTLFSLKGTGEDGGGLEVFKILRSSSFSSCLLLVMPGIEIWFPHKEEDRCFEGSLLSRSWQWRYSTKANTFCYHYVLNVDGECVSTFTNTDAACAFVGIFTCSATWKGRIEMIMGSLCYAILAVHGLKSMISHPHVEHRDNR
jgi:hypothetical protein